MRPVYTLSLPHKRRDRRGVPARCDLTCADCSAGRLSFFVFEICLLPQSRQRKAWFPEDGNPDPERGLGGVVGNRSRNGEIPTISCPLIHDGGVYGGVSSPENATEAAKPAVA
jgi:hypothetical protein